MEDKPLIIRFLNSTADEASIVARGMADELGEIDGVVSAKPKRDNPQAQDFGSTIVLILGTASVTAIAQGIKTWLSRTGTDAEIDSSTGNVILKNVASKEIAEIAKAISRERSAS